MSKIKPKEVKFEFDCEKHKDTGRFIQLEF